MWHDHDIDFVRWLQCTLQCDTWLWHDMPLNSPKRPPYWNSTSGFNFHKSPQSTCHSVPVCKILSKSDHPQQKKMTSCRFSRWRISAILDCRDPIMGSLKSPCTTSYRSSIGTVALNCVLAFSFWENRVFLHFGDRQTHKHTDKRTNSGYHRCVKPQSRCRELRLNNTIDTAEEGDRAGLARNYSASWRMAVACSVSWITMADTLNTRFTVVSRMSQTMCVEIFSGVQHDFLTKLGLSACITSDDWRGVL